MAPPKRKTGGRVTPKANPRTSPGGARTDQRGRSSSAGSARVEETGAVSATSRQPAASDARPGRVAASSRYTPKVDRHQLESPPWVPVLMLAFFVVGGLAIMARYLVWDSTNLPMVIGLACLLAGLFTATKWR